MNRRTLNTTATITNLTNSGDEDDHGNAIMTEVTEETQARITPSTSTEDVVERDTRINIYAGVFPPEVTLQFDSKVTWTDLFGITHEKIPVDGEPVKYAGVRGTHHIECTLKEVLPSGRS